MARNEQLKKAISQLNEDSSVNVIFTVPGIGVGKKYCDLSGCTSEISYLVERLEHFTAANIHVYVLSTVEWPKSYLDLKDINFIKVNVEELSSFSCVEKNNEKFLLRRTYIWKDGQIVHEIKDLDNSTEYVDYAINVINHWDKYIAEPLQRAITLESDFLALQKSESLKNGAESLGVIKKEYRLSLVEKFSPVASKEVQHMTRLKQLCLPVLYSDKESYVMPFIDNDFCWYSYNMKDMLDVIQKLIDFHKKNAIQNSNEPLFHYHLRGRFENIIFKKYFDQTVRSLKIEKREIFFDSVVVWNDETLPSLRKELESLYIPKYHGFRALIHGDTYSRNILRNNQGIFFIDPRVQWEDESAEESGYMDPLYDYATFLHSKIINMILADDSVSVRTEEGRFLITSNIDLAQEVNRIIETIDAVIAKHWPISHIKYLIFVYMANALFGWIKYPDIIKGKIVLLYATVIKVLKTAKTFIVEEV